MTTDALDAAPDTLLFAHPCPADLAGQVVSIVGYRERGRRLRNQVEMAPLVVPLVISFAGPFEIALGRAPGRDDRYASFTSGLYPGHVLISSNGDAECVQVDFTPQGARRFFGLPMHLIAQRMVQTDDMGDRDLALLCRQLGEDTSWDRRFARVTAFLRRRLGTARPTDPAIGWAYDRILKSGGRLRVADLARQLEWSRKHLAARFHDEIGIGPKAVARMARFGAALALSREADAPGWAEIAADCGYADQAHLAREFRVFAGSTPAAASAGRVRG